MKHPRYVVQGVGGRHPPNAPHRRVRQVEGTRFLQEGTGASTPRSKSGSRQL